LQNKTSFDRKKTRRKRKLKNACEAGEDIIREAERD
jgi:hypothetical protein